MPRGTVKWFNPTKGYGFIQPQDVLLMSINRQKAVGRQPAKHVDRETVCKHQRLSAAIRAARQEPKRWAPFVGQPHDRSLRGVTKTSRTLTCSRRGGTIVYVCFSFFRELMHPLFRDSECRVLSPR
jgi:cold-shock-like DNA binding protein